MKFGTSEQTAYVAAWVSTPGKPVRASAGLARGAPGRGFGGTVARRASGSHVGLALLDGSGDGGGVTAQTDDRQPPAVQYGTHTAHREHKYAVWYTSPGGRCDMLIEILGSGGARGTPAPGCLCRVCTLARARGAPYSRMGPSCYVHELGLLIDTPEEARPPGGAGRTAPHSGLRLFALAP